MVTQVIGDNVARAFSLVGALSGVVMFTSVAREEAGGLGSRMALVEQDTAIGKHA